MNINADDLKLSQIVQFMANDSKQREWDNIITCHAGESTAKTWSFARKTMGKHSLSSKDCSPIKSVWLSACGNFGFLGSSNGQIDKYNMQSGLYRSSFKGHIKAITALASDNVNMVLISASLDLTLKVFKFS